MKKFNSSDLSHKRTEVMTAARNGGAIIQTKRSNGEVMEEFVLTPCVTTVEDGGNITRSGKGDLIAFGESTIEDVGDGFRASRGIK